MSSIIALLRYSSTSAAQPTNALRQARPEQVARLSRVIECKRIAAVEQHGLPIVAALSNDEKESPRGDYHPSNFRSISNASIRPIVSL